MNRENKQLRYTIETGTSTQRLKHGSSYLSLTVIATRRVSPRKPDDSDNSTSVMLVQSLAEHTTFGYPPALRLGHNMPKGMNLSHNIPKAARSFSFFRTTSICRSRHWLFRSLMGLLPTYLPFISRMART